MDIVTIKNKRLSKYLYSLGFDRECKNDGKIEYWQYKKSNELQEALDFYFAMRKKTRQ